MFSLFIYVIAVFCQFSCRLCEFSSNAKHHIMSGTKCYELSIRWR